MYPTRTCCCCFSLRTGCIIFGLLALTCIDIPSFIEQPQPLSIVDLVSNVCLIFGAAMRWRYCVLPAFIINILINIAVWILSVMCIFGISFLSEIVPIPPSFTILAGLVCILIALFHIHIIKVIKGHFDELGMQNSCGQTEYQFANGLMLPSNAFANPSAIIVNPNVPYMQMQPPSAALPHPMYSKPRLEL